MLSIHNTYITVTSNHKEIKKHTQKITRNKPSINKHNLQEINFPSAKMIRKNQRTIT